MLSFCSLIHCCIDISGRRLAIRMGGNQRDAYSVGRSSQRPGGRVRSTTLLLCMRTTTYTAHQCQTTSPAHSNRSAMRPSFIFPTGFTTWPCQKPCMLPDPWLAVSTQHSTPFPPGQLMWCSVERPSPPHTGVTRKSNGWAPPGRITVTNNKVRVWVVLDARDGWQGTQRAGSQYLPTGPVGGGLGSLPRAVKVQRYLSST